MEYYTNAEALACMRYVSGTKLDERVIRCDLDIGYKEGRQFGRGKSGGQVGSLKTLIRAFLTLCDEMTRCAMSTARTMTQVEVDGEHKRSV